MATNTNIRVQTNDDDDDYDDVDDDADDDDDDDDDRLHVLLHYSPAAYRGLIQLLWNARRQCHRHKMGSF